LQSQLNISKGQNEHLKKTFDEYRHESLIQTKEQNKKLTLTARERGDLELEVTMSLRNDLEKTRKTRFDHKMFLDKDAKNEETMKARHDQE
jgi:hypothetical protein